MAVDYSLGDRLDTLSTESASENFKNLDTQEALKILEIMNTEDEKVISVIREILPQLASVVEKIVDHLQNSGRVIYVGSGTSGRIGALDASEIRPTFGTPEGRFVSLMSGEKPSRSASPGESEDDSEGSFAQLDELRLNSDDVIIGIAASGRTPYVIGALKYANSKNCFTLAISANLNSEIGEIAREKIEFDCGSEVVSGSTRLKAGTAQKLILNMISTTIMILEGRIYGNLMVDMLTSNAKLKYRALRIIVSATGVDIQRAEESFKANNQNIRQSIVSILLDVDSLKSAELLAHFSGNIHDIIGSAKR